MPVFENTAGEPAPFCQSPMVSGRIAAEREVAESRAGNTSSEIRVTV